MKANKDSHRKPIHLLMLVSAALILIPSCIMGQSDWQPLFNGKNLEGWTVLGGDAEFEARDNMIVGSATMNTPNTFLTTEETYSDFILEYEVKVHPKLNSGVQIRSLSKEDYRNGRVHGYQVEIDPSERAWSGGIYDEARRGWLYPMSRNKECRTAFNNGKWNKFRVEAKDNNIRTWINGEQCANLADNMTSEGFIGLQVHSIGDRAMEGAEVKWKNINIITENIEEHSWKTQPDANVINWMPNRLSEAEKRKGWRLLWDGKTSEGWRNANSETFPEDGWFIQDGVLTIEEAGGGEARNAGDIVTKEEFSSFIFEVDFKISEGANSGIKYFVVEGINPGVGSAIGPEFQILDDERHPDAKRGVNGNRTVGSLYDLITAENLSEPNRAEKRFKGVGEWNKARIVVRGTHVEHWLNNIKIVEYERGSQIYRNLIRKSKYKEYEDFGEATWGHILLQDHGNRVSFRSIKIREL